MRRGADAWGRLREREHLLLVFADLDDCCGGGQIEDHGDHRLILLDHRLGQVDRHAVLMHELVHDELDLLWEPETPDYLVEVGERLVRRRTVDELMPPKSLEAWVEECVAREEPVSASMAAAEWRVPLDVAQQALSRLWRRRHGETVPDLPVLDVVPEG